MRSPAARALNPRYEGIRLVRDDFDRSNFADRGRFVLEGRRPYLDVPSEYPELATYLFGLPYLLVSSREAHMAAFPFLMAAALGGVAWSVGGVLRRLGRSEARLLLLLLPGTLYFTLNRFDAVPALLVSSALALLLSGRVLSAHALLAMAVMTKAYPLLYLPLFVLHTARAGLAVAARATAVLVLVLAGFSAQLAFWVGPKWVLGSYLYFGGRMDNTQSLFHHALQAAPAAAAAPLRWLFRGLQGGLGLAVLLARPRGEHALVRWLAAMTIGFVVFSRFQSPQWVVWITPLALLASRGAGELALVAAQDVLTYVYFPVAYDRFGPPSAGLAYVLGLLTSVRMVLLAALLWPGSTDAPEGD